MGYLKGKTAIVTGAGRAVLSDGRCGSIGYGTATAYAKEGANLVITGSNAKMLSSEMATVLTGRYIQIEMLPFSLYEMLRWHDIEASNIQNERKSDFY